MAEYGRMPVHTVNDSSLYREEMDGGGGVRVEVGSNPRVPERRQSSNSLKKKNKTRCAHVHIKNNLVSHTRLSRSTCISTDGASRCG